MKKSPFLLLGVALSLAFAPALTSFAEDAAPAAAPAATPALDFGDYSSSAITTQAWKAYEAKDYGAVMAYTGKCIDSFKDTAVSQQAALTAPLTEKEQIFAQWALNDVGTCYFIRGQAYEAQGKNKEALADYKFLVDKLAYAQCWDPKGWFWKPASAASEKMKALEFDSM